MFALNPVIITILDYENTDDYGGPIKLHYMNFLVSDNIIKDCHECAGT